MATRTPKTTCPIASVSGQDWLSGAGAHERLKQLSLSVPAYDPQKKFVRYRRLLVDWILDVARSDVNLGGLVAHSAIQLMDRILSLKDVSRRSYELVATVCLLVAAKAEEHGNHIPRLSTLQKVDSHSSFTLEAIRKAEIFVLDTLQWQVFSCTPLHFLIHFHAHGILFPGDSIDTLPCYGEPVVAATLWHYSELFAELCHSDYSFLQHKPEILASSIVGLSRKTLRVSPLWPVQLEQLTQHSSAKLFDQSNTTTDFMKFLRS